MKIVIDIPDDMYNDANILIVKDFTELKKAIINGTPLPKGHGDLIDRDVARKEFDEACLSWEGGLLKYIPAVIEADK